VDSGAIELNKEFKGLANLRWLIGVAWDMLVLDFKSWMESCLMWVGLELC
jgi:hypothetical protein